MKKTYYQPECEAVELLPVAGILAGSDDTGNPWAASNEPFHQDENISPYF